MQSKQSSPSVSSVNVNVPEIQEFNEAKFTYNYYTKDERINPFVATPSTSLEKLPRYVTLTWTMPALSEYELSKNSASVPTVVKNRIEKSYAANSIIYEDDFSPNFFSHTFSDVSSIEQGSSDLENFSRINKTNYESVYKMAKEQIATLSAAAETSDVVQATNLANIANAYTKLADFPKTSLGLRVYDETGTVQDSSEFLSSISDDLSLHVQINASVIPDIFKNSNEKKKTTTFSTIKKLNSRASLFTKQDQAIIPADDVEGINPMHTQPVQLLGYIITRYVTTADGFKKDAVFFVEDYTITTYVDKTVLYGITYTYSISVVAALNIMVFDQEINKPTVGKILVASRQISKAIECNEYVPPPEPEELNFVYDYQRNRLVMSWNMPVNPQNDVKQFQVMRRKSIKHPFELIAQYSFDNSYPGLPDNKLYTTGEIVDGNAFSEMQSDYKGLVKLSTKPVYLHVDEDFMVDTEFSIASSYIYAVCSIDAHGMISNYSSQHHVTFDPYKNRLITKVVCDAGSPRPYPNMKLRMDAFKDTIRVSGDESRQMSVYFTPEYLRVIDDDGKSYKIIEGDAPSKTSKPYYVLQLINLDNQKTELIKFNVLDPTNLTA